MLRTNNISDVKTWTARQYRDLVDRQYEDHWTYEGDNASVTDDERIVIKEAVIEDAVNHFVLSQTQAEKLRKYVEAL